MTMDIAAVQKSGQSPVLRVLACPAIAPAANDNRPQMNDAVPSDEMLRSALRHFAQHGLGAARAARLSAEEAFFSGDRAGYDWWLGITRTLDRRLAIEAEMRGKTILAANCPPSQPDSEQVTP